MSFPHPTHISKRLTPEQATDLLRVRDGKKVWLANRHAEWTCWDCLGGLQIAPATTVVRLIRAKDGKTAPTPLCTQHTKWRVGHGNFTC